MNSERTRILITNDDGIHSEGIAALEASLSEIADVYVVAPESEMSGAAHSLTLAHPLRIRQVDERHWTVDGTPTAHSISIIEASDELVLEVLTPDDPASMQPLLALRDDIARMKGGDLDTVRVLTE